MQIMENSDAVIKLIKERLAALVYAVRVGK